MRVLPGVALRRGGGCRAHWDAMTVIDRLRAALPGSDDPAEGRPGPGGSTTCAAPTGPRGALVGFVTGLGSLALVASPSCSPGSSTRSPPAAPGRPSAPVPPCGCSCRARTSPPVTPRSRSCRCSGWPCSWSSRASARARPWSTSPRTASTGEGSCLARSPRRSGVVGRVRRRRRGGAWPSPSPGRSGSGCSRSSYPSSLVPLVALALALRPVALDDPDVLGPRLGLARVPDAVRRGVRPGPRRCGDAARPRAAARRRGGRARLARGLGDLRRGRRDRVRGGGPRRRAGPLARQPRHLGRVLPGGPGVPGRRGRRGDLVGSEGGLLPMVPVLAALPQPGAFPWFNALSVLVVVVVGALVARRALREVARLSRRAHQARGRRRRLPHDRPGHRRCWTSSPGGSVGQFRLSSVGAPAGVARPRTLPRARGSGRSSSCSATPGGCADERVTASRSGSSSSSRAPAATSRHSSTPRARPTPGSGSSPSGPTGTAPAGPRGRRSTASRRSSPGCPTT